MSSGPIFPDAAARPRRSALGRLAAVYFAAFVLCALMFLGGAYQIVHLKNIERVEALIEADREAILDKIGEGPDDLRLGKATAIVLARSAGPARERRYRLDQNGRWIAGGIPAEARFKPRGDRLLTATLFTPGQPQRLYAETVSIGAGGILYIGRIMDDQAGELTRIGALALLLAALSAFVVGPWAGRGMLRRVQAINAVCDRVRGGDLAARAPGEETGDEFGALAGHINAMLERTAALVLGLRDVSNRIAHDLRTPMARLKSDLQTVAQARTLEEAKAMAGEAAAETDEILQTFEALLDIAEAEAGSDAGLEPMFLDDAAQSAVDLYGAVAEDRGVRLTFDRSSAPILGERSLVMRLAANLLDNAIKFSPRGSVVGLKVAPQGEDCLLMVEDHGPGIPAEECEQVMRRFGRGSGSSNTPGYGLGLALVAAVAKRHGAKIRLEDANPGLRVTVRFRGFRGGAGDGA
ncbi:MAG: ATP-binding protein [Caulobacteraceae bacterium]